MTPSHRSSPGCPCCGSSPGRSRSCRSRGSRAARTASPWAHRTGCICAPAHRETSPPGRTRGNGRRPRPRAACSAASSGWDETEYIQDSLPPGASPLSFSPSACGEEGRGEGASSQAPARRVGQRRALRAVPTRKSLVGTLRFAHPTCSGRGRVPPPRPSPASGRGRSATLAPGRARRPGRRRRTWWRARACPCPFRGHGPQ